MLEKRLFERTTCDEIEALASQWGLSFTLVDNLDSHTYLSASGRVIDPAPPVVACKCPATAYARRHENVINELLSVLGVLYRARVSAEVIQ